MSNYRLFDSEYLAGILAILIIVVLDRWNDNAVPKLLEIIEKLIFYSQNRPDRSTDGFCHHGNEGE